MDVAAMESHGGHSDLPRLYGKQAPRGGWEAVAVPPEVAVELERWQQQPRQVLKRPAKASEEQAARKRPAAAASRNLCHGQDNEPCIFSTQHSGARARYQAAASRQCPWCNNEQLAAAKARPHGRAKLSQALRMFWHRDKEVFHKACSRMPADVQRHLPLQALGLPPSFHSQDALAKAFRTPRGKGGLLAALRKRQVTEPAVVEEALKAIPDEHVEELRQKLAAEPRRVRQAGVLHVALVFMILNSIITYGSTMMNTCCAGRASR